LVACLLPLLPPEAAPHPPVADEAVVAQWQSSSSAVEIGKAIRPYVDEGQNSSRKGEWMIE
jgi:hypothetical protein